MSYMLLTLSIKVLVKMQTITSNEKKLFVNLHVQALVQVIKAYVIRIKCIAYVFV